MMGGRCLIPHGVEQVNVQTHDVIYRLVDGVKEALEAAIEPIMEDHQTGTAEIVEVFTLTLNRKYRKDGMAKLTAVAGSRVTSGLATTNSLVRVTRGEKIIHEGKVISLRHFKQEVRSVKKGSECGMILHDFSSIKQGDMIQFYDVIARKPSLFDVDEKDSSASSDRHFNKS